VVLVDTSVWVADLGRRGLLAQYVTRSEIATCPPVVQEVLQGVRDEHGYFVVRTTLYTLPMLESPLSIDVFDEAAQIYRTGRATGFTIRSPFNPLIAACAIRNGVVLHSDRDFNTIARFTRLQSRYVAL
jgi:predicted nucleic acid-binding protein